ncbi:hypothetical protein [Actinoplanes sp. NPDC026619]|uniref:hypothetical protein n=1 Tax=Actinoplanes sp. NPDC026619 TaxID=3155798 RepID=UPI0033C28EFA
MTTPDPYAYGVYPSDGFHPADGWVQKLDDTWSVVVAGRSSLSCVLRRRDDGGIDLLASGLPISAVVVHVGSAPVRRYPGASRWNWGSKERWLVFASAMSDPDYINMVPPGQSEGRPWRRTDLQKSVGRRLTGGSGSVGQQLSECGYQSLARNEDGAFEVLGDPHAAGPLVGRSGAEWRLLQPGSELRQWDESRSPFRGAVDELRLFHRAPKSAESGYPSPHFHLGDGPDVADAIVVAPQ